MTSGQIAYALALCLVLGVAQPPRATVWAMVGNLAAMLTIAGTGDIGLLDASGSLIFMMLADLACAAFIAFTSPALAVLFGAMVPVYAIGLFAELPRGTTLGIVGAVAIGQLLAILGGYGGGGGLRDYIRRSWDRRGGHYRRGCDVVSSEGAQE